MDDAGWAIAGRLLADALMKFAKERGDAERKRIAELETEICRERRFELRAFAAAEAEKSPGHDQRTVPEEDHA